MAFFNSFFLPSCVTTAKRGNGKMEDTMKTVTSPVRKRKIMLVFANQGHRIIGI